MSFAGVAWERRLWIVLGLLALAVAPLAAQDEEKTPNLDVPYVPTKQTAVEAMLDLAKVTANDFVIDLGCGDGRIVVTAAKKHKAKAFGIDLDPKRIKESNENATKAGVTDMVKFQLGNALEADVSKANVVTLFLLESVNVQLRPRLFTQLKPGSRVVSNSFTMRDWKPDKEISHDQAYSKKVLFWVIPASVGGTWTWQMKVGDKELPATLKLQQEFQAAQGTLSFGESSDAAIADAALSGKELSFTAKVRAGKDDVAIAFRGTAEGDSIQGTQEWAGGANAGKQPWAAKRQPANLIGAWQIRAASDAEHNGTLTIKAKDSGSEATYALEKDPKTEIPLKGFYAWGTSVRFELPNNWSSIAFSGTLSGDSGSGTVGREQSAEKTAWTAKRLPAPAAK